MPPVRMLLFSDLHESGAAALRIVQRAANFDILVCAGDLANARRGLETCVGVLRRCETPTILVPGNNETVDELRSACKGWGCATVLHGAIATIKGVTFFGLGGGVPVTPFGSWSWDFSEPQATELLRTCPAGCVLVSHSPPHGAVDQASTCQRLGSTAVRAAVERCRPRLVVCGHIHASAGRQETIGQTTVINAGPAGVEWTLRTP